jgi:hypothetical protein
MHIATTCFQQGLSSSRPTPMSSPRISAPTAPGMRDQWVYLGGFWKRKQEGTLASLEPLW